MQGTCYFTTKMVKAITLSCLFVHKMFLMLYFTTTGVGNHSRGQAALPTAVRSFLIENG